MSTNEERGSERRRFVRYHLNATADVMIDGRVKEQGAVHDISTGGMFLNLEEELPRSLIDKKVNASIYATTSGEAVTIEAECSIVRTTSDGVALFFSSIDSENRKLLHDLIGELNNLVRDSRK